MNRKLHFIAAALAFTALGAQAQTAGSLLGRVGITQINPDVRSGNLTAPSLPGSQADVGSSTRLGGGLTGGGLRCGVPGPPDLVLDGFGVRLDQVGQTL